MTYFNDEGSNQIVDKTTTSELNTPTQEVHTQRSASGHTRTGSAPLEPSSPDFRHASVAPYNDKAMPSSLQLSSSERDFTPLRANERPATDYSTNFSQLGPIAVTNNPFLTGNKHHYNMLRPTIYKRQYESIMQKRNSQSDADSYKENLLSQLMMKTQQLTDRDLRYLGESYTHRPLSAAPRAGEIRKPPPR